MKLAIIGSRDFTNYQLLADTMRDRYSEWNDYDPDTRTGYHAKISEVISGGARGADKMAAKWVEEYNGTVKAKYKVKLTEFIPDWQLGRHAGFMRNEQIIHTADEVLAFWDGVSRGTAHSLSLAKKSKKPTMIIYF